MHIERQSPPLAADQLGSIILTCAVIISRQCMDETASFVADLVDVQKQSRQFALDLVLNEDDTIELSLQKVSAAIASSGTGQPNAIPNPVPSNGTTCKISHSPDLNGLEVDTSFILSSHASENASIFQHVYSQIYTTSTSTTVSQIEVIGLQDLQWLASHSVHSLPVEQPISGVDVFSRCAAENPRKTAVEAWDGSWTYQFLDEESTRMATVLVQMGIQPLTIVPLMFPFSKWVPVMMLALWKAGAAFVFVDPAHPQARLETMISRVGAQYIVADASFSDQILVTNAKVLYRQSLLPELVSVHVRLPQIVVDGPAYVIFTSGSTGEPKAVVHTHRAFSSGVIDQGRVLRFSADTRILENAPLIFAGAIAELLFTLCTGGCICIPQEKDRIADLPGCVRRLRTNTLIVSSSSAAIHDPLNFVPRQTLLMGAEPLPEHTARRWAELHDNCNGYGSTETNTVATCSLVSDSVSAKSVGAGGAHQYWVVDPLEYNRLVPPGWLGEILVEGYALASGYLGNDDATRKAFPPTPRWYSAMTLGRQSATRFFRSGDLGRIASDGSLEVHGRTDPLQIKLRGQRVELGDIEANITGQFPKGTPIVAELILPHGQDRPSIAVFIATKNLVKDLSPVFFAKDLSVSTAQLEQLRELQQKTHEPWNNSLPAFMRPSYLIPLIQLPRTATGKIDRQQLRRWSGQYSAPDLKIFATSQSDVAVAQPLQTETEVKLRDAISKVLRLRHPQFDGASAFTVLGGDSLTAIQLATELRKHDLIVSAGDIVQSRDLTSLATVLEQAARPAETTNGVAHGSWCEDFDTASIAKSLDICPDHVSAVLPTTDTQARAIELGAGQERCFVYHFVIRIHGTLSEKQLAASLQRLVDRHDSLRTMFTHEEGRTLQVVLTQSTINPEICECENETDVLQHTQRITQSNVRFGEVPTKFWLLRTQGIPAAFIFRLSHAQFDGMSMPIIWKTLHGLYKETELCPAASYADYAQTIVYRDVEPSKEYWRQLLRDCPFTDLVERPATMAKQPQNCHFKRRLSLRQTAGFTPSLLFEVAWAHVLASNSHAWVVSFDHIVSGRQNWGQIPSQFDFGNLVGACLNDVPVVVTFHAEQTLQELMTSVRSQHVESAKHETLGFRSILGECKPNHWPRNAHMTSSVQYRGFEETESFTLGAARCEIEMVERSMDLEDLTVLVTPDKNSASGQFDLEFLYSDEVVDEAQAAKWFEQLVHNLSATMTEGAWDQPILQLWGSIQA